MTFDWYNVFSIPEFQAEGLVSKNLLYNLQDIGEEEMIVVSGNLLSLIFRDVILPVQFFDKNPTVREGEDGTYAVYVDENDDVWLGIEVAE